MRYHLWQDLIQSGETSVMDDRNEESDEELLAHEIFEDRRLVRLGIDPEGDPVDIMLKLRQMREELHNKDKRPKSRGKAKK